jgi:peptide/nickel transport system permease protein
MTLSRLRRQRVHPEVVVAAVILLLIVIATALPALLTSDAPNTINLRERLLAPVGFGGTLQHPLGTDTRGRDMLSRLLYGGQVSLTISVTATAVGLVVGVLLGMLAGYVRGMVDHIVMYLVDLQLALPFTLLAIFIALVFGSNLVVLTGLAALSSWPSYARLTRGLVLSLRERDYVTAAIALGAAPARILRCHLFPNVTSSLIALTVISLGRIVLLESGLSFIGIGFDPATPSWGSMIAEGRGYLTNAWWIAIIPSVVLSLFTISIGTLGDWLHDVLNVTSPV